jgi:hypothetical protein
MDRQENIEDPQGLSDETNLPVRTGAFGATPRMALISIDLSKFDPPMIEVPKIEVPAVNVPRRDEQRIEMAAIDTRIGADPQFAETEALGTHKLTDIEAPHIAPEIDATKPEGAAADAAESTPPEPPVAEKSGISRFTLLAASLALAAGIGGMLGALAATSLARSGPTPVLAGGRTSIEEFQALKENVVQARVELAALKATIDAGNRNANAQFTKIGERIERVERVQADPNSKLSKAIDTLDRMSRADASSSKDVTGSIVPPLPMSGAPKPLGSVDGWVLRDVRRGTALIEGRMGIIEVDAGDVVPGLGRVDAIRKQADGRWVVVTTRGLIMSAR